MLKDEFSLKESWINGGSISLSDFGVGSSPLSWKSCGGMLSTDTSGQLVFGDTSGLTPSLQIDEASSRISLRSISERVVPSWYGVVEQSYGHLQDAALEVFELWQAFESTRFVPIIRFFHDTLIESVPSILIRGTLWVRGTVTKSFISGEEKLILFMKMLRFKGDGWFSVNLISK